MLRKSIRTAHYYTYTAGSGASCVDARFFFPLSRCDLCMSHPISVTTRRLLLQYVHILPPPSPVRLSPCSGNNFFRHVKVVFVVRTRQS